MNEFDTNNNFNENINTNTDSTESATTETVYNQPEACAENLDVDTPQKADTTTEKTESVENPCAESSTNTPPIPPTDTNPQSNSGTTGGYVPPFFRQNTQPPFTQPQGFHPPTGYPQGNQPPYTNPQPPYQNYQQQAQTGYSTQNPNPYSTPPYGNPYPQPPVDFYNQYPQPPQKEKMSSGLKALIIIIIAILVACVIGFTTFLAFNSKSMQTQTQVNPNNGSGNFGDFFDDYGNGGGFSFGFPDATSPTFPQEQSNSRTYDESDASKKTNKDYKGVDLEKKPADKSNEKYNASYTFKSIEKAVVGIACYYEEDKGTNNYQSQGTGIIITSDGYIVTNSHVIGNSRKAYLIKVITADKKEYAAGVVGYDSRSDLAVLKIDASGLPVAKFGDSTYTEITEEVVAIGNPSGIEFQNSITKGIVSALDRKVSTSNNVEFIQIDAAINPGNSGGPLCNMYGQVIGINTAKIASESFEGMGFAIPSATVKKVVDDIIKYSYVTNRVKVGITGQAVTKSQAGVDGIQIVDIAKDGPMDGTGAQANDIIVEVDGEKTTTFAEIFDVLEKHKEGDKVKIKLYRPSEKKNIEITVKLQMDKSDN